MTDELLVFEHKWITVKCEPARGLIRHQIHQYVFGQVFHDALLAGVRAMKEHSCNKWLSDDRKNGPLPPEELIWVEQEWAQQALDAGWRDWALVPPAEVIGQMNIQRHVALYRKLGVTVELFGSIEQAERWLDSR